MSNFPQTTWDGKPISSVAPFGATVLVYRLSHGIPEFLILHRSHNAPDYEEDWAWTPPSGARYPGESPYQCAARELEEETGLSLTPNLTTHGTEQWWVYALQVGHRVQINLSPEHDRYAWMTADKAVRHCSPKQVSEPVASFAAHLQTATNTP